jgi:hypothetical protein
MLLPPGVRKSGDTLTGPLRNVTASAVGAAGTTQGTATALTAELTRVNSGANNSGVILPTSGLGRSMKVYNATANTILVYPPSGGTINALAGNAAFSLSTQTGATFNAVTNFAWFTG